ncbi:MAG TPA: hypothetical protein VFL47_11510 [Flavisolibacter sp.]|nr:hypothetical protein [Flavisolibacter sp.]
MSFANKNDPALCVDTDSAGRQCHTAAPSPRPFEEVRTGKQTIHISSVHDKVARRDLVYDGNAALAMLIPYFALELAGHKSRVAAVYRD